MKLAAKQISKKVISCILALAVLLCSITCVFSVFADSAEVYSVTYGSPAIPMFIDKAVDLNNIEVQFTNGGVSVQGDSITWALADGTDTADVSIEKGHYLVANKTGIHKLTASANGYEPKNIYVVVNDENNENKYDFYLVDLDFTDTADFVRDDWMFAVNSSRGSANTADYYKNYWWTNDAWNMRDPSTNATKTYIRTCFYNGGYAFFYNAPILRDFSDYTFESKVKSGGSDDLYTFRGLILRANVNFDAGYCNTVDETNATSNNVTTFNTNVGENANIFAGAGKNGADGSGLYIGQFVDRAVSLGAYGKTPFGVIAAGFESRTLHSLTDHTKLVKDTADSGYTFATSATRTISITLNGSDIKYSLDGNLILDTTSDIYQLYRNTETGEYTNTAYTDYHTDFAEHGVSEAGNAIGFVNVQSSSDFYTFKVKLNVATSADLPEFVEVPEDITPSVYSVSFGSPAIPLFVDKGVDLTYIQVQFAENGEYVNGDNIEWSIPDGTDSSAVLISNGGIYATKTGIHKITAKYDGASKDIYVIANEEGNYNFYLVNEDLSSGIDLDEWEFYDSSTKNGTTKLNVSDDGKDATTGKSVWAVGNGYTVLYRDTAGYDDFVYMMYKSDVISDFTDYTVSSRMRMAKASDLQWKTSGFAVRADFPTSDLSTSSTMNLFYRPNVGATVAPINKYSMYTYQGRGFHTLGDAGHTEFAAGGKFYNDGTTTTYAVSTTVSGSDVVISVDGNVLFDSTKTVYLYNATADPVTNTEYTSFATDYAATVKTNAGMVGFVNREINIEAYDFTVKLNVTTDADLPEFVEIEATPVDPDGYIVTDTNPVIPMTAGTKISTAKFGINIDGVLISGADFTWDTTAADTDLVVDGNYIYAYKKGAYILTAQRGDIVKTVYVVVKNQTDSEYVVFENDYRSDTIEKADGTYAVRTDYDSWDVYLSLSASRNSASPVVAYKYKENAERDTFISTDDGDYTFDGFSGYNNDEIKSQVQAKVDEGNSFTYVKISTVLNNEILKGLTNYKVTADFLTNSGTNSSAVGLVGRVSDTDKGVSTYGVALNAGRAGGAYTMASAVYVNGVPMGSAIGNTDPLYNQSLGYKLVALTRYSLEFNGTTMTYSVDDFADGLVDDIVVNDVPETKGTVGFVSLNSKYGTADTSKLYGDPNIYSIKVTLTGVKDTEKLGAEPINNYSAAEEPMEDIYIETNGYSFTYQYDEKGYIVTGYTDPSGLNEVVRIPAIYNDGTNGEAAVYSVAESVFANNYTIKKVVFETATLGGETVGVTTINANAFNTCVNLEKIILPETLNTTGSYIFRYCFTLNGEVVIPAGAKKLWGGYTFERCWSIDSAVLNSSMRGARQFSRCYSLTNVYMTDDVEFSDTYTNTFYYDYSLVRVRLPESMALIPEGTFKSTPYLESITVPETVTAIGKEAFSGSGITSISLPSSVASIGTDAFTGSGVESITIYNAVCDITEASIPESATIYGIEGSTAQTYATANGNTFVPIEMGYVHEIFKNSITSMPTTVYGASAIWETTSNDLFRIYADGTVIALNQGTASVQCTLTVGEITVNLSVPVKVGEYNATANNFAPEGFTVTETETENTYILSVKSGLKHSTLRINGNFEYLTEIAVDGGISSGTEYTLVCDDLLSLSIEGEFESDLSAYKTNMYAMGATVENPNVTNAHKLKFVFRAPAIIPTGTTVAEGGKLADNVVLDGNEVTLSAVGVFMIPEALLIDPSVMPTLKDGFDINSNEVKITNSRSEAANVKIKYLDDLTYDYADFYAVLTNIADNMSGTYIVSIPYIVYEVNGETKVAYGESITRSHDSINESVHITEEEMLSLYRADTEERITEIKNTATSVSATGTAYYISSSTGSDTTKWMGIITRDNDGTDIDEPIKTLDRLNELNLGSGDVVYFKRGDTWRGQVVAKEGVTYSAYGDGAKPEIWASPENGIGADKWTAVATNIYKYSTTFSYDVGTIVFNGGAAHGIKAVKATKSDGTTYNKTTDKVFAGYIDLDENLHFYHDTDGYIYLYCSEGNPAEVYSDIEFSINKSIFYIGNSNGVTIDNILMRYCGGHAVGSGTSEGLKVQNCEFYWIGGSIHVTSDPNDPIRYGNGVEIYGSAKNFTVDNCYFYQVYDAAVTFQYSTTETNSYAETVKFTNNVMEYCNYSIEYFIPYADGLTNYIKDIEFSNNLMWYAGYGFCEQRPDRGYDAHIKSWSHINPNITNFKVSNNLFALAYSYLVETYTGTESSEPIKYSGNTYIQYEDGVLGRNGYLAQFVNFDKDVRNTINSKLGDTGATVIWVK